MGRRLSLRSKKTLISTMAALDYRTVAKTGDLLFRSYSLQLSRSSHVALVVVDPPADILQLYKVGKLALRHLRVSEAVEHETVFVFEISEELEVVTLRPFVDVVVDWFGEKMQGELRVWVRQLDPMSDGAGVDTKIKTTQGRAPSIPERAHREPLALPRLFGLRSSNALQKEVTEINHESLWAWMREANGKHYGLSFRERAGLAYRKLVRGTSAIKFEDLRELFPSELVAECLQRLDLVAELHKGGMGSSQVSAQDLQEKGRINAAVGREGHEYGPHIYLSDVPDLVAFTNETYPIKMQDLQITVVDLLDEVDRLKGVVARLEAELARLSPLASDAEADPEGGAHSDNEPVNHAP